MLNYDSEMILLSAWAKGNHKEDMVHFEPSTFSKRALFEEIRDGATISQLGANLKKKHGLSIAELLGVETALEYHGAKGEALQYQINTYIYQMQHADPDDRQYYIDKITETNNFLNAKENHPKVSNYKELFFTELEARQNEKSPHYGIRLVDNCTEGMHRGQLITLSARPGQGKSALALQIANHVIEEQYKVLYFPLEMTPYETIQRSLIQTTICYDSEEVKHPTDQQKEAIGTYLDELESSGLFLMYYGCTSLAEIEKKIKEEKPYLAIIDQLTQVEPVGRSKDIREKYIKMTGTLKHIALQEEVCIIAVHQLNRESTDRKKPSIENLAESDSVGRDSDVVLLLIADEEENQRRENESAGHPYKNLRRVELIIAKNRQGRVGERTALEFNGSRYTFSEVAPKSLERGYRETEIIL